MKKSLFNTIILLCLFSVNYNNACCQYSATILSEQWEGAGGQGTMFNRSVVKLGLSFSAHVAGATINGFNNSDILIQKFHRNGTLLWQQEYAGAAGANDFATDLFIDHIGNVYVTGSIVDSVAQANDLVVLKYNSDGVFQWKYTYHGSSIYYPEDAGISITGDNSGHIYVTGSSGGDTTLLDYITIALNANTGAQIWESRYDYDQLIEAPRRVVYHADTITVIGASQEDDLSLRWEVATVRYSAVNGAQLQVARSNTTTISQAGANVGDIFVDQAGNMYITGTLYNDTTLNHDIALMKFNSNLQLAGLYTYDFNGDDDYGKGIKVDQSGNSYITGYSTAPGLGKEVAVMKIDNTGTLLWKREITGPDGEDDEGVQLALRDSNVYVVAKVKRNGNYDFDLYMLSQANGDVVTSATYNAANLHDEPQSIAVDLNGDIVVTGIFQTGPSTFENKTFKYRVYHNEYDFVMVDSVPAYLAENVLIKFRKNYINTNVIDRVNFVSGQLSDFVDSSFLTDIEIKTGKDWSGFTTSKVFRSMTTADSLSVTRLGDTIRAIDFWTTLLVNIPPGWDVPTMCDSLDSMYQYVEYSSPNYLFELFSTPNDELYEMGQLGLYPNAIYPGADINAEHAWDIEVGQSNVKIGIVDSEINWSHIEFNGSVSNLPGSNQKIGGGYNYYNASDLTVYSFDPNDNHGTQIAGIIGAKRNNFINPQDLYAEGIAGIAGGDVENGNFGVQLFPLITKSYDYIVLSLAAEAIRDGYANSPHNQTGRNFGLNIINASWGISGPPVIPGANPNPVQLLREAIKECWQNHCIFVTGRGATTVDPIDNPIQNNYGMWPACFDDKHLICVSASGTDGDLKHLGNGAGDWYSLYARDGMGNNSPICDVDVLAPGVADLITSTMVDGYGGFEGTSASAAMVSGVIALMYSQHQPINDYPNKLTTEDVENILQKTADDKGLGYTLQNAYGLVDAYEAVKQVSNPYYVKHLTSVPIVTDESGVYTVTIYNSNSTNSPILPNGSYSNCTRHRVDWNINEVLPSGHTIIDWWDVEAMVSRGLNTGTILNEVTTTMFTDMSYNPIGGNVINRTAYTYLYKINGNWYPKTPAQLKFAFSIHVLKDPDLNIYMVENDNFVLYPNPSNNQIMITSKSDATMDQIQIYDVSGRLVYDNTSVKQQSEISIDVTSFRVGMYYCKIISSDGATSISFIKSE